MGTTPQITAIEPQKNSLHRYSIFINGEFAVGVSEEVIANLQLRLHQPMPPEHLAHVVAGEQDSQTRRAALNLLKYRARSQSELVQRLRRKGLESASIDRVVRELEARGLVDDEQFARQMVSSMVRRQNLSKQAILIKLRQAGVERETARSIVDQELADYDERDQAQQAALRYMRHGQGIDGVKQRRRLFNYLRRRGFEYYLIHDVLKQVLSEE